MKTLTPFLMAGVMLVASSCVKEKFYNTNHPKYAKIVLTTDWSQIGAGVPVPASYTVAAGGYSATLTGNTNTINNLFDPGDYRVSVYNTPDQVTVAGTVASVAVATTPDGQSGTFINSWPEWLFTWTDEVELKADTDQEITAVMTQQVGLLNFMIEPTGGTIDNIATVTGTLTGVAGTFDLVSGTYGLPASVTIVFEKNEDDGNWYGSVRLLGIIEGDAQNLTIDMTFTDGVPSVSDTQDLSDLLDGFNDDKKTPLDLGAQSVETPTEVEFTGSITDWGIIAGTGTAN